MATFLCLGHLFGGQLFELFARETNLKKQSSVPWMKGLQKVTLFDPHDFNLDFAVGLLFISSEI
jgi:hypothetical protein